eukprot:gene8839-6221_t
MGRWSVNARGEHELSRLLWGIITNISIIALQMYVCVCVCLWWKVLLFRELTWCVHNKWERARANGYSGQLGATGECQRQHLLRVLSGMIQTAIRSYSAAPPRPPAKTKQNKKQKQNNKNNNNKNESNLSIFLLLLSFFFVFSLLPQTSPSSFVLLMPSLTTSFFLPSSVCLSFSFLSYFDTPHSCLPLVVLHGTSGDLSFYSPTSCRTRAPHKESTNTNTNTNMNMLPACVLSLLGDWKMADGLGALPPVCKATLLVAALAIIAFVWGVVFPKLRRWHYLSAFPTMRGNLPILGHALELKGPAPWSKMVRWSFKPDKTAGAKAGNRLVYFNVAGMDVIYVNHPVLIKRVLLTKQRNYRKAIAAAYKHFLCLLGTGLVTAEDEQWKKGRLLLSHALRIDILEDIPKMTIGGATRIMDKLSAAMQPHHAGDPFIDLNEEYRHMTLQVIGESALSLSPEETDKIFPALYLPIVHECNRRVWEPWRAMMPFLEGSRTRNSCLTRLNKVLSDFIVDRWENKEAFLSKNKPDILALCMKQMTRMDTKTVLELRDDAKTMLLAGHETSAALLTWATYECIRRPDMYQKVRTEAEWLFDPKRCKETMQTPYGPRGVPSADDVRELEWTPAVLRETMRLHSVVPLVMRYAAQDDVLSPQDSGLPHPVTIPAGCTVAVGIEGVHHNVLFWDDPEQFKPERFYKAEIANNTNHLNNKASEDGKKIEHNYTHSIDPYAYVPFINGPRNCLGQHLAIMETQVAISYLLLNWDLRLFKDPAVCKPGMDEETWQREVGRHHDYIIPQVPHQGLKVQGTPRKLFE